jgi:glucose-6-phosphate 1-dehydrogenase
MKSVLDRWRTITGNISQDEFRSRVKNDLKEFAGATDDCGFCNWLLERLYYASGDFRDPAAYQRLKPMLAEMEQKHGTRGNYFYYLATTPSLFGKSSSSWAQPTDGAT